MVKITVTSTQTLWEKVKGLLGTKKPHPLLLKTHWGIHTFGMKYPIDVVILNNSHTIVALQPNLPPNRIFLWNPTYETVLELPAGFIQKHLLKLGKKVVLEVV